MKGIASLHCRIGRPAPTRRIHRQRSRVFIVRASLKGTMPAKLIDGKGVAKTIREEVAAEVKELGITPGLATILVGDRKDSATYVNNKKIACAEVGIQSFSVKLEETATESELLGIIEEFNGNEEVDGILVQLPLPKHINEARVLDAIIVEKDVDGFHPINIGLLALKERNPYAVSCTPQGCMELLARYNVEIAGKRAVVIGRSNINGMPVGLLLQQKDATVTTVHSRTPNAKEISREADIIIAACGQAEMVTKEWIKEGAVIIDVGINSKEDPASTRGYRLVGDVLFDEAVEKASMISPVPGGVGPMTVAMLMRNTLESAVRRRQKAS